MSDRVKEFRQSKLNGFLYSIKDVEWLMESYHQEQMEELVKDAQDYADLHKPPYDEPSFNEKTMQGVVDGAEHIIDLIKQRINNE